MVKHLFLLRSDILTALGGSSYSTYFTSLNGKHFGQHHTPRSEDFGKPSYLAKLGRTLAHNEKGEPTRMIHALDTSERTVAEVLKGAGYFTAIIGKWHCGEWLPEHLPMGQGFMHQYGHYAWGIDYNNYTIPHNAPARFAVYDWHRDQEPLYEQGYSTDLFANEGVRLISQQSQDRPFFLYVPFNAVHGPIEDIPRYTDTYSKREAALKCLDDAIGRIVGANHQETGGPSRGGWQTASATEQESTAYGPASTVYLRKERKQECSAMGDRGRRESPCHPAQDMARRTDPLAAGADRRHHGIHRRWSVTGVEVPMFGVN